MLSLSWLQELPGEASFVTEGSEASFVTATSHAAPAGSVVSDLEYASLIDEAEDELQNEAVYGQVRLEWLAMHVLSHVKHQCVGDTETTA